MLSLKFLLLSIVIAHISAAPSDGDQIYTGCGTTKQCLGYPDENCVQTKDCVTFSSTFVRDGKIIFEMKSWKGAAYIAMGLSDDRRMGDDSVMECVKDGDQVKIFSSWTKVKDGEFGASRDGVPQNIIHLVESNIEDDRIYCQVERDPITKVKEKDFNLNSEKFFMMMVSGGKVYEHRVRYHDLAYTVTKDKIDFKA